MLCQPSHPVRPSHTSLPHLPPSTNRLSVPPSTARWVVCSVFVLSVCCSSCLKRIHFRQHQFVDCLRHGERACRQRGRGGSGCARVDGGGGGGGGGRREERGRGKFHGRKNLGYTSVRGHTVSPWFVPLGHWVAQEPTASCYPCTERGRAAGRRVCACTCVRSREQGEEASGLFAISLCLSRSAALSGRKRGRKESTVEEVGAP